MTLIPVIIITHGGFGQELLRTAQDMVGAQDRISAFSVTPETGGDALVTFIKQRQSEWNTHEGALYLVDMLGGTPCNASLLHTKGHVVEIVTGVNLYMVLSAFKNRTQMPLKDLAVRVAEDGRKSILLPLELLSKRKPA